MILIDRVFAQIHIHAQASGRHSTVGGRRSGRVGIPLAQLPADLHLLVIPDEGSVIFGWDWDQIELRLFAALASDQPLLDAFANQYDVHTLNACDLFGLSYPPDKRDPHASAVCAEWRQTTRWTGKADPRRVFAKRFVYRLMYGGDPKLAYQIPGARAIGVQDRVIVEASFRFLSRHPAITAWQTRTANECGRTGMSWTFADRPRRLQGNPRRGNARWSERERAAFDHPMQGGCTDIYEKTILEIEARYAPAVTFFYGVHDSQYWHMTQHYFDTHPDTIRDIIAIAEWPRLINEQLVAFPITPLWIDDTGKEHQWLPPAQ